jgi:hypothetical protein
MLSRLLLLVLAVLPLSSNAASVTSNTGKASLSITFTGTIVATQAVTITPTTLALGFVGYEVTSRESGSDSPGTVTSRFVALDGKRTLITAYGTTIKLQAEPEALAFLWPVDRDWPGMTLLAAHLSRGVIVAKK